MSRTSSASCRWPIGHKPSSARAKPGSGRQTASVVLARQDVHSFGADDSFCDSTPTPETSEPSTRLQIATRSLTRVVQVCVKDHLARFGGFALLLRKKKRNARGERRNGVGGSGQFARSSW